MKFLRNAAKLKDHLEQKLGYNWNNYVINLIKIDKNDKRLHDLFESKSGGKE